MFNLALKELQQSGPSTFYSLATILLFGRIMRIITQGGAENNSSIIDNLWLLRRILRFHKFSFNSSEIIFPPQQRLHLELTRPPYPFICIQEESPENEEKVDLGVKGDFSFKDSGPHIWSVFAARFFHLPLMFQL